MGSRRYLNCRDAVERWRGLHGELCEASGANIGEQEMSLYVVWGASAAAHKRRRDKGFMQLPKAIRTFKDTLEIDFDEYDMLCTIFERVKQQCTERQWKLWWVHHVEGRHQRDKYPEERYERDPVLGCVVMRIVMVEYPSECLAKYPSAAEVARAWNAKYASGDEDRVNKNKVRYAADRVAGLVESELSRRGLLKARVERAELVQEDMAQKVEVE